MLLRLTALLVSAARSLWLFVSPGARAAQAADLRAVDMAPAGYLKLGLTDVEKRDLIEHLKSF